MKEQDEDEGARKMKEQDEGARRDEIARREGARRR